VVGSVWNEEKHGSRLLVAANEGHAPAPTEPPSITAGLLQQRLRSNAPIKAMSNAAADALVGLLAGDTDAATVRAWIADLDAMVRKEIVLPSQGPVGLA
jgi:hypothetical protein